MWSRYLLMSIVLIGAVKCQSSEPSLSDALSSLPPELQGKVDEAQIKSLQNTSEVLFKEKCDKNGGQNAYNEAKNASNDFKDCLSKLVNPASLQQEIEDAKPNGKVDEVFKGYCAKTPQFKECFKTSAEKVKVCLSTEEKGSIKTIYNITDQLADFICYKDGDRIALFIAEGGPDCIQSKQEEIQTCVNSTIGASGYEFNTKNITANVIPKIVFNEKECGQFDAFQVCVVKALESCSTPTTANIVESLFKFVKQATPCQKFELALAKNNPKPKSQTASAPQKANSASGFFVTFSTIVMAVTMTILA